MNSTVKHKQSLRGKVVSISPGKTAVVEVARYLKHPKYKKYLKRSKKYSAHCESGQCKIGETVVIESNRPLSKTKKWKITNIL